MKKFSLILFLTASILVSCKKDKQLADDQLSASAVSSDIQVIGGFGGSFSIKSFIQEMKESKDPNFSMQPLFKALGKMETSEAEKAILEFNTGQGKEPIIRQNPTNKNITNNRISSIATSRNLTTEGHAELIQQESINGTSPESDPNTDPSVYKYPQSEEIMLSGAEIWTDDFYNYRDDDMNGTFRHNYKPIELVRTSSHKYEVARHTFDWFRLNSRVSITKKWFEESISMHTPPNWKITGIANEDVFLEGYFPFTTWIPFRSYPRYEIGRSFDSNEGGDWASETVRGFLDNRLTAQFPQLKNLDKFLPWTKEIYHTQIFQ